MPLDECDEDEENGPPSRNSIIRAAALMAGEMYNSQTGPHRTMRACAADAAKTHKVKAVAVSDYLMVIGSETLQAVEAGADQPETPNAKRARAAIAEHDRTFACLAYGEGCSPSTRAKEAAKQTQELSASPFGRVLLGLEDRVQPVTKQGGGAK